MFFYYVCICVFAYLLIYSFVHMATQLFQHYFLKKDFLFHYFAWYFRQKSITTYIQAYFLILYFPTYLQVFFNANIMQSLL